MSVTTKSPHVIFSKASNSKVMALRRQQVLQHAGPLASNLAKSIDHPVITIPANEMFMRFVPQNAGYLKNYDDVFRLPPNVDGGSGGKGLGGYSDANRFTGVIGGGALGLNGSYWGKADGVAGEDAYYSMWKDYDDSGPPRLMAKYGFVTVQRAAGALNYWEDQDVPKQLLFSGNSATNIIVARTIRPIRCLNLNLSDPAVQAHLKQNQPKFQQLLTGLEFDSLGEAIEDSEFREFARQYAHGACLKMLVEGIWVRTVRHELGQLLMASTRTARTT